MKVILSRKGFDCENGGMPSPLMPDGRLVSLPIPSWGDLYTHDDLKVEKGLSYADLIYQLKWGTVFDGCHADPDLSWNRFDKKPRDWRPGFGQVNQSLTYLDRLGVGEGDLFLFFGTFRAAEFAHERWHFAKGAPARHIIWGYLQVGKIVRKEADMKRLFPYHPHTKQGEGPNAIYGATKKLSFCPSMPGSGLLPYADCRVLTKPSCTKATWNWNDVYAPNHICGNRKNSATVKNAIYYSGIWQELCLEESAACTQWARRMVTAKG